MVSAQGPAGPRRRLGAELRRLRGKSGLHLEQVAAQLDCSTSKISRLETGKGIPKLPDVRRLMQIYGVEADTERDMLLRLVGDSREHGWWETYTDGVAPERFVYDGAARYPALESDAVAVKSFDLILLHGLLQTEAYARAVISALMPQHPPDSIEQLVELRLRRQDALRRDLDPLLVSIVLDEMLLMRPVGGGAAMVEQLQAILELSRRPNVDIRVLPLSAGIHRVHMGHFVVLEFGAGRASDVVYVEGHAGDAYLESESDVAMYKNTFADVADRALPADAARAVIARRLAEHASREGLPDDRVPRQ